MINDKAKHYIGRLIPNIGDRSMNDPVYLVPSSRVFADMEKIYELLELERPRHTPWWSDKQSSEAIKRAISEAAYAVGWSEVIFKGGQVIFIADIHIVK